jgi:4-hydroxy-3-methylbut-2-enyl diphosphate reductase
VIEALVRRFPAIQGPNTKDICYATQSRQTAVIRLAEKVQVLLVVGARNSSNSNRLREVGERHGLSAHLIEDAGDLRPSWFAGTERVAVTAGASTPEVLVRGVVSKLRTHFDCTVSEMEGEEDDTRFRLPESIYIQKDLPVRG